MDQPPFGSKLPAHYENPLDFLLIKALVPLMPTVHALGVTPNMLTAASAICAAVSLYFMVKGQMGLALTFWALNYMFDLADGLKARLYDEQSVVGCRADHLSDVLSVVGLYAVIALKLGGDWSGARVWPLLVEALLMCISVRHFVCQERYSQERTSAFIPVEGIDIKGCENVDVMHWTRWFGIATLTAWHLFLIYFYIHL